MRLTFLVLLVITSLQSLAYPNSIREKIRCAILPRQIEESNIQNTNFYNGPGIRLEGPKTSSNIFMGPEIPIPYLSGFYDWQTNGECKHQIHYTDTALIQAIYMTSSDSLNIVSSRRTRYSVSSTNGLTWGSETLLPSTQSGFCYMCVAKAVIFPNTAIIANHSGTPLKTYLYVDAFPGLGSFTSYPSTMNYAWPQVNSMDNGKAIVTGSMYNSGFGSDTILMQVFTPNNGNFSSPYYFTSSATDFTAMRWTNATGPGGKSIIISNPVSDEGGNFNQNRIFYWTSENYGETWSGPNILFDAQIDQDGDTSKAWLALDAMYDNLGNFYVAFNTINPELEYSSAKIWINKNGTTSKIIARNSDIPGAMEQVSQFSQQYVCSMDWPSLSISENGQEIYCAYSVAMQNDVLNGFNSMDIFMSIISADSLNLLYYSQITDGINDERYVSLNKSTVFNGTKLPCVYQKDPQPGSSVIDFAPISRATLIYRQLFPALPVVIGNSNFSEKTYNLYQNYPNPFNPATNIKFDIPKSGNVKITVYDITGKQVAELLNQDLSPGTYETSWSATGGATGFASGVYYYSLEAEGFKETRKMLLIK